MVQNYGYMLEQSRTDKIKTLGFLCYNLHIDGLMNFSETNGLVGEIKHSLGQLMALRQSEPYADNVRFRDAELNEKLTELGCVCYNLYVDSRLFNNELLALCDSIAALNYEISQGARFPGSLGGYPQGMKPVSQHRNVTASRLKISCPRGMELIPANFRRCGCGYRNRPEARYCGKCGSKLA